MAVQFDARLPSDLAPGRAQAPSADAPISAASAAEDPVSGRSVAAEYAMSDAAQRSRIETPAETAPQPADDLSRIGAAFGHTRPPQMLWNEHSANVVGEAGRQQNGLSETQATTNAELAGRVMQAAGGASGPLALAPADVALLLQASGLNYEKQDPGQLLAATRYINAAPDPGNQQERIRKTLDGFHILDRIGHPQLPPQQMKDLLWGAANVPGHAFGTMNQAEVAARYQDVAAALNGAPGKHEVRIGKHNLKFTLDAQGAVTESSTKKPSVWGKIGRIALTVASFVPIPVVAIPARIASAALSTVEGIKNGNWVQAVAGAAGGVAATAGAIAGKAVAGAAATTAKVASQTAKAAAAVQAGIDAARGKNALGVFASTLQATSNAAGAFAEGAGDVAKVAKQVQTWANRSLVGTTVAVDLKQGNIGAAINHGAVLTASIAGDFKRDDGSLPPAADAIRRYAGYGADAGRLIDGLERRDYAAALTGASGLSARVDAQLTPGPQYGAAAHIAEYLNYAGSGSRVIQDVRQGRYESALTNGAGWLDNVVDGRLGAQGPRKANEPDLRPGWARAAGEWMGHAATGAGIVRSVVAGSLDKTLAGTSVLLGRIDAALRRGEGAAFADTRTPLQRVRDWLDQAVAILRGKPAGGPAVLR